MAELLNMSHVVRKMMRSSEHNSSSDYERSFALLISDVFKRARWKVVKKPLAGVDLLLKKGTKVYIAEVKRSAEARPERAIPLLAQAILQVQTAARLVTPPATPLAIIAAERMPEVLAAELQHFGLRYAPEVAIGVFDLEGFRSFRGWGLEGLNAPRSKSAALGAAHRVSSPQLFSDLKQWMLKVLLAPAIPEPYLSAPRREFKNTAQLAHAAGVPVMSALRLVRNLRSEGFLDESSRALKLVRVPELLQRWQASYARSQELSFPWIIAGGMAQFENALRDYYNEAEAEKSASRTHEVALHSPRACLGLFTAADALGNGLVHGVPPSIYLESADPNIIRKLGLSPELSGASPDVFVRIAPFPETVFRACVTRNGVPVTDALQVWLDVSNHPAGGREQAEQLKRGILADLFAV